MLVKNNTNCDTIDTVKTNRRNYIGGSDVPTLLGVSKFKSKLDLLNDYSNTDESTNGAFADSEYTEYGNLMESQIRDYVNSLYNLNCEPSCIIYEDLKIRCNTDGYDKDNKVILEIKTNNGKHSNTLDYELQMQLYMWAFDVEKGYLVQYKRPSEFYKGLMFEVQSQPEYFDLSFDPKNVKIKEVKRVQAMNQKILKSIEKFWEEVKIIKERKEDLENESN